MDAKTLPYVGELIRKEIKDRRLTNGYLIKVLHDAGIEMSDTKFSNKIYGVRDEFTPDEITVINNALGTSFKG